MLPLVIRIKDADSQPPMEKQYVFTQSPVRIGRNQLNDIPINRAFVSLFHALVRFDKGSIFMVDLGSTNGINVGGQRIEKNVPVRIKPGMDVKIGSVQFHFSRDSKAVAVRDSSRLTQFRALSEIQSEALSFKPTPVQERKPEVRTALLPSLNSLLEQEQDEVTNRNLRAPISPTKDASEEATSLELRTVIAPAPGELEEEVPPPRKRIPEPPSVSVTPSLSGKRRTVTSGANVIPQAPGATPVLQSTIQQLVPLYNAYRTAWKTLHQGLARGVDTLPEQDRAQLITQLVRRMPEMAQEPAFQEIAKNVGRPVQPENASGGAGGSGNRMEVLSRELLNQFVRSYLPDSKGLQSEQDIQSFLEHLADLLETFGRAFVELRQGNDQFGQQMAVPVTNEDNPLSRMKSPREVLRYLLDFKVAEASQRVQELMGGFGDMMIHQIAVLSGLREGVKDVLERLSPERLDAEVGGIWPFHLTKRWSKYAEQHRAFLEEERELTGVLFGPAFAKAYLAILGESANKGGAGDEDDRGEQEEES